MDYDQRLTALEAEMRELRKLLAPKPRAAPLGIGAALERVTCTFVHRGKRRHLNAHRGRCIYVLINEGTVTYVGRSRTGFNTRHQDHDEKAHDRVVVFDLKVGSGVHAEPSFDSLEGALIAHYSPLYNIAEPRSLGPVIALWPSVPLFSWIVAEVSR